MNGIEEEKKNYENFRHKHKSLFAINLQAEAYQTKYQMMMGDVRNRETVATVENEDNEIEKEENNTNNGNRAVSR